MAGSGGLGVVRFVGVSHGTEWLAGLGRVRPAAARFGWCGMYNSGVEKTARSFWFFQVGGVL